MRPIKKINGFIFTRYTFCIFGSRFGRFSDLRANLDDRMVVAFTFGVLCLGQFDTLESAVYFAIEMSTELCPLYFGGSCLELAPEMDCYYLACAPPSSSKFFEP